MVHLSLPGFPFLWRCSNGIGLQAAAGPERGRLSRHDAPRFGRPRPACSAAEGLPLGCGGGVRVIVMEGDQPPMLENNP